tara:strand:+ start:577 stop:1155 length:579 start_codon:yes stop_codon:yes gene_type:complete
MKLINRGYPLAAFLTLILFSQVSNAIIITSYTGFFEDGSKLVVDLKGYDYGTGSYYSSPVAWNEQPHPPIEGFDTFFYPSSAFQDIGGIGINSGEEIGNIVSASPNFTGLHFTVDEYSGVSMTNLSYVFSTPDWSLSNTWGINTFYTGYHTDFSGGFFKTSISPYPVDGPGSLALMIIGIAGLGWARQRRKA